METKQLLNKTAITITPTSPFHFDSTFYKPGHFPSRDTKWKPGKRWQSTLFNHEQLGLVFENSGGNNKPKININIYSEKKLSFAFLDNLKKEIIWRYNLDLDLAGFYHDLENDSLLKPILQKFRGLRPMNYGSLYEYLIIAIMLQNTVVKRSVSMLQSLFENYGTLLEFDGQQFWSYWEPKVMAGANEQGLRNLKVGYRAKTLIRVSIPFANHEINEQELRTKSKKEQEETLLSLYGVGPQSVGYIMFDAFHHWDYMKNISPWEQKIYTHIFFDKDHENNLVPVPKMLKRFGKWSKWKGLAVNYVWEDIWWKRRNKHVPWLESLIRL